MGTLSVATEARPEGTFYRELYRQGIRRIIAREHTALLDDLHQRRQRRGHGPSAQALRLLSLPRSAHAAVYSEAPPG